MTLAVQIYDARYFLSFLALFIFVGNKYRKYRRLQNFPGPFSTGWSEAWHTLTTLSRHNHLEYHEVSKKYGRIARVGPNDLLTSSHELLAHMNSVRSPYTRSAWYNTAARMRPGRDNIFSQIDEEEHTKRRQQMASGYSGKENLALESDIDNRVLELLNLIRTKYTSTAAQSRPVDIGRKIQYFTLDVISSVGFGEPFGDLEADADLHDIIKSTKVGLTMITIFGAFGLVPYLQWPLIAHLLAPSETDKTGVGRMMYIARNVIDSRLRKPLEGRSDMLASFMRHGLSKDELLSESLLQIVAGSDTTATTLRCTLLYIVTHPQVYRRLQEEVDAEIASNGVDSKSGVISDSRLKILPYLQAVVREGLRIHPPVTDVVPKKVPKGGDKFTIDGQEYFFPEGTNISYSVWSVQHDKDMFGEDAEFFRPERWLLDEESDKDRLLAMRRTTDMIFGYGKYQCLGKPVAWMETTKVLFEFMRHFEWTISKPETPWTSQNYFGIFLQNELWVTATERGDG
ncbi:similar to benzoate 4-monooxygenase cytochrome P450 [Plenodomus lingam JN3]|uniref:Cytochrome P450 monooxygenase ABA1 n=1 Tax=Leptosphaeria maculans (strain JN3 / isolate v23.1.3 / race Av1-4-5-6-7-8) TaxID=985895 RepID=E5A4J7_LEPMJ|nr:similar to benzoate 4-monooxygenase cytochrome P450 [Plenodomus lingam JN3]CBX98545.1 similar to benzoate 4-monooxygenase cytochrome P450 [Plenodomus lingam JN3]